MHIKKILEDVIARNKSEDMIVLSEIFEEMAEDVKHHDHRLFKDIKYKMHKMAYGEHLTKEMADEWVSNMKNKDGTHGAHWTREQTDQYAANHNKCDWFAILNMMYSDYFNPSFDTATYIKLAKDWFEDKDVEEGKTLKYYFFVVK